MQESSELHESSELYESSSKFEIKNEMEQIDNHLDFSIHAKLKTVANIMYQKNKLDQLIKKK